MDSDRPISGFRQSRLQRIARLEDWHFWFVGRRLLVSRLLRRYAGAEDKLGLDMGCGTGRTVRELSRDGYRVIGLDVRPEGLAAFRSQSREVMLIRADAERLPLRNECLDLVLALDILEHVDDGEARRGIRQALRPGGLLLAGVPALPWLWSHRDRAAGHRRRYTRHRLVKSFEEAGFMVLEIRYYQFLLLPAMAATRILGRKGPGWSELEENLPRPFNRVLTEVSRWEVRLGEYVPWPLGSSLFAVGSKRDDR